MNPWMQVTGWTLIHFVWQGALLTLATAAGLRLCQRRSSEVRYAIACAALTAMLASPVITAVFFWAPRSTIVADASHRSTAPESERSVTRMRSLAGDVSSITNDAVRAANVRLEGLLSFFVWGWLAGVALLLARFAGGFWRIHRLAVAAVAEATSQSQSASERLAARLRLEVPFRVVESGLVDAPTVIGWIRPAILLPVAALTNLSPAQIEAILAHELAHIRRRDYVVNLLQTAVETLLFYHPGVWWVSARVRQEREHCCDDVAVAVCGEPTDYAAALVELAFWRSRETALTVAATDGSLLARVRRLVHVLEDDEPRSIGGFVIAFGVLLVAAVVVQSPSLLASGALPGPSLASSTTQVGKAAVQSAAEDWRTRDTVHFTIYYPPDLDLHAERVEREAERAYAQVSSDLRHSLAARVPIFLFHNPNELARSGQAGGLRPPAPGIVDLSGNRILLVMDRPADEWYGLIAHEVAHVFGFDIIPGTATPRWIREGLAEYERGAWEPNDLVTLRDVVRANAIPRMSSLDGDGVNRDSRVINGLGHATFDFIESRWGKSGVRQFIFWVRQTDSNGGDPYEGALQVRRDEFDQAFERYLTERLAASLAF